MSARVVAFIDETGISGDRIMLAGYAARADRWHGFQNQWRKLLAKFEIPYSHMLEMREADGPFSHFDSGQMAKFIEQASKIINGYCGFGLTAAVDKRVHKETFAGNLPPKTAADSAYGMCARQFFEKFPLYCGSVLKIGNPKIDFVFERQDQFFKDAIRIFDDLRLTDDGLRENLRSIRSEDGKLWSGLQAADMLAYWGRRAEPTAQFVEPENVKEYAKGPCPTFRISIEDKDVPQFHRALAEIGRRRRYRNGRRKRGESVA